MPWEEVGSRSGWDLLDGQRGQIECKLTTLGTGGVWVCAAVELPGKGWALTSCLLRSLAFHPLLYFFQGEIHLSSHLADQRA